MGSVCALGIDPGLNTGIAVIGREGELRVLAKIKGRTKDKSDAGWTVEWVTALQDFIDEFKPDIIGFEYSQFGKHSLKLISHGEYRALASLTAAQNKIPFFEIHPKSVKLQAGSGNADKKYMIKVANIIYPNMNPTHDQADAIFIAQAAKNDKKACEILFN